MAATEEPILTGIDRLDNMGSLWLDNCCSRSSWKKLEVLTGNRSPKSSFESTPSSGTLMSDGHVSSIDFSPKSWEKHCRPIYHDITDNKVKGTLIERLDHLEDHKLKIEAEWHERRRRKKEELKRRSRKTVPRRRMDSNSLSNIVSNQIQNTESTF